MIGWDTQRFPVLRVRAVALAVATMTHAVACADLTGPPIYTDAAPDAAPDSEPDAAGDAGIDASVECASADDCLGGSDCTVASCPGGDVCVYTPENAQCDDDGDLCTFATCDPELGCQTVLDDTADKALWDNGPLITHEGAGPDGTHLSVVQNSLGLTTRGFNVGSPRRGADDFEVTSPGGWHLTAITFFAYQVGSGTTSTLTHVSYRI